jgi:hypothetical protein
VPYKQATCSVFGGTFGSTSWERSKKLAEQAAAGVALMDMGVMDEEGIITMPEAPVKSLEAVIDQTPA